MRLVQSAQRLHDRLRVAKAEIEAIPDSVILSEYRRRFANGRPRKLRPCPECGLMLGARQMIAHVKEHAVKEPAMKRKRGLGKRLAEMRGGE